MEQFDIEIKVPGVGGMNLDIIDSMLPQNNTRLLLNGRRYSNDEGLAGSVCNIKGTVLANYGTFSESAMVLGVAVDTEYGGIIYFVEDGINDAIIEYFPNTNVFEDIMRNQVLNFNPAYKIKNAIVIDGKLYWNDSYNPPRKCNINKAKNNLAGDYENGYPSIDTQTISLIKYPHLYPLKPFYSTDQDRETNSLRGVLFQFRVRYVYDDDEESVASPISKVAVPVGEMDYTGEVVGRLKVNNCIKLPINTGHSTVKQIIVYSRVGNTGHWGEVDTIDKKEKGLLDNDWYEFVFYNDSVINVVDQLRVNKPYHAVPLLTDIMAYLHTNNMILGGLFEGYDNLDLIYTWFIPKLTRVDPIQRTSIRTDWPVEYVTYEEEESQTGDTTFISGMLITGLELGNLPVVGSLLVSDIEGHEEEYLTNNDDANDPEYFRTAIVNLINSTYSGYSATIDIATQSGNPIPDNAVFVFGPHHTCPPGDDYCAFDITLREYNLDTGAYKPYHGFKSGAEQNFGLLYYDDAGRSSFVQKTPSIYLPFLTEPNAPLPGKSPTSSNNPTYTQNYNYTIDWAILHQPPLWATKYQWCRQTNSSVLSFHQYIINGITHGDPDPDKSAIDISPLNRHKVQYNEFDYSFPNSSINPYIFQKGDRIRFITKEKTNFSLPPTGDGEGLGYLLPYYLDLEILEYKVLPPEEGVDAEPDADVTNSLVVQRINPEIYASLGENTLVEIYTPKRQQDDLIYYEMGDIYDIVTDPGNPLYRIHKGPRTDQSFDVPTGFEPVPATGTFVDGDIYFVPTVFVKNMYFNSTDIIINMIESLSANNFYSQNVHSLGRPNLPSKKAEQKKSLNLRLSEKYFENTEINGLSEFYGGNDIFVSAEYGTDIVGLEEVGYTLKVVQPRKVTSFFVGRTGLQLASGAESDQLQAGSDDVLSTKSPSKETFGCENQESIIVIGRHLFFVDIKNGAIIRDAANGMTDISDYGVKSEIKKICRTLLTKYSDNRILGHYNPVTEEVCFSFTGINKGVEVDLGSWHFKDKKNEWTCVFYYNKQGKTPTRFTYLNQDYISFIGADLFLHEKSETYNVFYGTKQPLMLSVVFNKDARSGKLYRTVELSGKGNWKCPTYDDIEISAKNSITKNKQLSRLVAKKFKNLRGTLTATLLKDANSQNGINLMQNLLNGKDLRGNIININFVCDDDTEAFVDSVAVFYQKLQIT